MSINNEKALLLDCRKAGYSIVSIDICSQLGLMRFSGVGHSVDVGAINNEDRKIFKLVDGEWKVTEEADW